MVLNLTVYVRNIISFVYKQKKKKKKPEILIFRTFLAKKSVLAYILLKIANRQL